MDPRIILASNPLDVVGAVRAGADAGQAQTQYNRQNALAATMQQNGPGILAGDPNALNALARFDPQSALGIKGELQGQAIATEEMQMKRAEGKRLAAERIAAEGLRLSKEEAAAEAAKIERGVAAASTATTPEQWDALAMQFGAKDLVGQFANKNAIVASYLGVADALNEFTPAAPDLTSSQKDYNFYAQQEGSAGRVPLSFNDWDLQARKASATTNSVTIGGSTPQEVATHNKIIKADNVAEVIADIRNTRKSAVLPTTGFFGEMASNVSGTASNDVRSNIETLKAAASFTSLQAMREASKTGAALGSITERELSLLGSELANLEQNQSDEQFERNLTRFERTYNEIVHGPGAGVPDGAADFSTMEVGDVLKQDVTKMSPEQLQAFSKRMEELGL